VVDLALSAPPQIGNELTSIPERENVNSAPLDEKRTFWLFAFGCDWDCKVSDQPGNALRSIARVWAVGQKPQEDQPTHGLALLPR
jgi:hypothetical protein